MKIKVGVSNRHIHICEEDFRFFFLDEVFSSKKELSQDGEFASNFVLSIKTPKNVIDNVRIVGPFRDKTQVEISVTDAYFLGISPNVRMSGDLSDACDIILCNGEKELLVKKACIIANRHIHVNTNMQDELGLHKGDIVSVKVDGLRGGIFDNVIVKAKDNYNLELHLDTDEANAMLLKNGDEVEIIMDKGE